TGENTKTLHFKIFQQTARATYKARIEKSRYVLQTPWAYEGGSGTRRYLKRRAYQSVSAVIQIQEKAVIQQALSRAWRCSPPIHAGAPYADVGVRRVQMRLTFATHDERA
ncbi:hypothetical protein, partial [Bradyrhizobium retamae]|uniref:hypothetical protein n=1 Tax=Bradyrhizobium retamae TaxID=1300035 RepID=UPI001AECDF20